MIDPLVIIFIILILLIFNSKLIRKIGIDKYTIIKYKNFINILLGLINLFGLKIPFFILKISKFFLCFLFSIKSIFLNILIKLFISLRENLLQSSCMSFNVFVPSKFFNTIHSSLPIEYVILVNLLNTNVKPSFCGKNFKYELIRGLYIDISF